ncbi:MAG: hypothetical protein H0X38_08000 [Planctomycetes bacterium]|nr:hypothetical protein [Planctomycetota bacterium]
MRIPTQIMTFLLSVGAVGLLASCGAGGGGASVSQAGGGSQGSAPGAVLGERAVPGYTLRAHRVSTAADGTITVRVHVTPDAGQPLPTAVTCWIAGDYVADASTSPAAVVAGTTDEFEVMLVMPQPLPADAAVWVRLTFPDGTVLEVGRAAFPV